MSENRKPHVIALRTAAVLLILVMLSTSMVAGRYARYTTTAYGSDSARVARFSVTEEGSLFQTVPMKVRPGSNIPAQVVVTNNSEVAVAYSIEVVNHYNNLPLTFKLQDGEAAVDTANLAPGEVKTLKLLILWDEIKSDDKYIGMVDLIDLTIHVTQID